MLKYNPQKIEHKWQKYWEAKKLYRANDNPPAGEQKKPKYYQLETFPYPSAAGLHVGHPKGYIAEDIHARYMRMMGKEVLYTIGWDAFGLPTENYAIKVGKSPQEVATANVKNFKKQVKMFGLSYDWDREINTSSSEYYKWTQWLFIQLFKAGLAYQKLAKVNWCPSCMTVLANEQAVDGKCERCGTVTIQKEMKQWFLRITDYAERLLNDLDELDPAKNEQVRLSGAGWPEATLKRQKDWIGKSEGAKISFALSKPFSFSEIVFASGNSGKVKRMRKLFKEAGLSVIIRTPEEIGIKNFGVVEDAETLAGNSEKKAWALAALTDLPVLADDSGFFVNGVKIDPVMVKRNALSGVDERSLSVEQIAERMQRYYKDIASSHGGQIDAEWRNALCLIMPDKSITHTHVEAVRPVILTNKSRGKVDPHLPLRGLYISKATGKYVLEQTEEEELKELKPITDGIKKLFGSLVEVFTTRPDTLFGATFLVVSPELAQKWLNTGWSPDEKVKKYIKSSLNKKELERLAEAGEKTGVDTGIRAINSGSKEEIPIWIADYVLGGYGTGAVMAVPAHDQRDFEFAKKFNLPIKMVICPNYPDPKCPILDEAYEEAGHLVDSGKFDGMDSEKAKWEITKLVGGEKQVQYKLRDWSVSRQRYWGVPIPIIYCDKCALREPLGQGIVPVPEKDLPVKLPILKDYRPKGIAPLASSKKFLKTRCPNCKGLARRDAETLDTFVDSSWYYLRYVDPKNNKTIFDKEKAKNWLPVKLYVIGAEHTTLHLLYARFISKFLRDMGYINYEEPFLKLRHVGLIQGSDGQKMSKSRGNVVNPDPLIKQYGADAVRMYEMFMGPFEDGQPWSIEGVVGVYRFLSRVWNLFNSKLKSQSAKQMKSGNLEVKINQAIKKIGEDIDQLHFNTCVSELMKLLNEFEKVPKLEIENWKLEIFAKLLAPFAPHLAEELWSRLHLQSRILDSRSESGHTPKGYKSIHLEKWPEYDSKLAVEEKIKFVIQVNGRVRDTLEIERGLTEDQVKKLALTSENVKRHIIGDIKKIIYIQDRIINLVI